MHADEIADLVAIAPHMQWSECAGKRQ